MTNQISHVEFLEISPELAVKIGLNESIILKQLTILIDTYGILMDGVHWVAITYNEWQEIFPFWSTSTIKRIFASLEKMTNQISHVEFLEISPDLAVKIGLNESIILKQLTILIDTYGVLMDGLHWVAITYNEWQEIFPFWSTSTIKRIFTSLEKMGLIKIEQHGKHRYDRTNWYCICEHTKKEIRSSSKKQKVELEQTKNSTSKRAQPMSPELENKYQKVKKRLNELCFFPLKADQKKELREAIVTYPLQQILVAIEETAARSIFAWKYAYKVLVTNQTHVSRKPTRQEILPDWFGKDDDTIYEFSEEELAKKRRLEAIQAKYREAAG